MEDAFLESLNGVDNARKSCNCLPECTSISYDYELSPSKLDMNEYVHGIDPTATLNQ